MRRHLERFFLREWPRTSAWQFLLRPLSWLFMVLAATRRTLFAAHVFRVFRARVPVVVVGNITVGGAGKTPVVLALAAYLRQAGYTPGMVTRGYAPTGHHAAVVHVTKAANPLAGDEALLLAGRSGLPVYAGVKRADAARTLLAHHAGTNVVISDDGLQHHALARDIEIAVVDGVLGFGNGRLLPAGPLRESISRLRTVDCIILNNTNIDAPFQAKMPQTPYGSDTLHGLLQAAGKPVFAMTYGNETFMALDSARTEHTAAMLLRCRGKQVAAVAGIGNPARFFDHLARLGITLASQHAFADHHAFVRADFDDIQADIILMTGKDAVKCAAQADDRMWAMQVDALLPDAFYEFIRKKIDHVTRSQAA